jgi:hypothetical protein
MLTFIFYVPPESGSGSAFISLLEQYAKLKLGNYRYRTISKMPDYPAAYPLKRSTGSPANIKPAIFHSRHSFFCIRYRTRPDIEG